MYCSDERAALMLAASVLIMLILYLVNDDLSWRPNDDDK
jgi:hypothetical protein